MNPMYTSPEQRPEAPAAIDLRLRTIDYARVFLEAAMRRYYDEEPASAPHVSADVLADLMSGPEVSPENLQSGSSEYVAPVINLYDSSQEIRIKQARQLVEKAQSDEAVA